MRNIHKGFSLIELILVISLLGMAMSVALANYRRTSAQQGATLGVGRLEQALRLAKSQARSNKKENYSVCPSPPASCAAAGFRCLGADNVGSTADDIPLMGWSVTLDTVARTFVVEGWCGRDRNNILNNTNFTIGVPERLTGNTTITLSNGLPSGTRILFLPMGQGVLTYPGLLPLVSSFTITIQDPTIPLVRIIRIYKSGEIQVT